MIPDVVLQTAKQNKKAEPRSGVRLVIHAGSSVTKEHSKKVQIKAAKRWNGGSISSFANTELYLLTKRTVT